MTWRESKFLHIFPHTFFFFFFPLPSTFDAWVCWNKWKKEKEETHVMWKSSNWNKQCIPFLCLQSAPNFVLLPSTITHNIKAHMAHSPLNWWESFLCAEKGAPCKFFSVFYFVHLLHRFSCESHSRAFKHFGKKATQQASQKEEKEKSLPSESM